MSCSRHSGIRHLTNIPSSEINYLAFPEFLSVVNLFPALKDTVFYLRKSYKGMKQISEKMQPSGARRI